MPGADPAGRTVLLEARARRGRAGFIPVGTATTGVAGVLRLGVTPETTTFYRWRYAGSADADRAASGVARVRVRVPQHRAVRIRTTLSIRLKDVGPRTARSCGASSSPAAAELGRRWVVLVSRPAGADGVGLRQRRPHRRPRPRGLRRRPAAGRRPTASPSSAAPRLRPSRSARVVVRTPSEVSISAVPGSHRPGRHSTVSGVVTAGGAAVAGRDGRPARPPMRPGAHVGRRADRHHGGGRHGVLRRDAGALDGVPAARAAQRRASAPGRAPSRGSLVRRQQLAVGPRPLRPARGTSSSGSCAAAGTRLPAARSRLQSVAPGTTAWVAVASGTTQQPRPGVLRPGPGRRHAVPSRLRRGRATTCRR